MRRVFALIETFNSLNRLWRSIVKEYHYYLIEKNQGDIDIIQTQREAYLDAIKQAQNERDKEKVLRYRTLLATNRLSVD